MLLEKISEKNNLITVSHSNELSEKLEEGRYNAKNESGDIFWKFNEEMSGVVFMEINFIEPTEVFEIDFHVEKTGTEEPYTESAILHSLDGINWYDYQNGQTDITPKFLRLEFVGVKPGFCMDKLKVFGEEKYKIGNELISLSSKRYYPQRFFEKHGSIPKMIHNFLEMLECNQYDKTIKRFFKNDSCVVEVFLIFDEGDEGAGTINSFPINTVPINTGSSTTYDGAGAVIINRIAGGGAFYNLEGRITDPLGNYSSIGLRFNSTVVCDENTNCGHHYGNDMPDTHNSCHTPTDIVYRWEFDDPFASNISGNPSTLSVASYGEVVHNFSMLGYYNVKFVMEIDGAVITGNQFIEISPSPYVIRGNYYAVDGTVYTVHGLTAWPDNHYSPPIITRRDFNSSPSFAQLIDNGDRTFTVVANGEVEPCKVRIFDEYYEEFRELNITFEPEPPMNALLDSSDDPILDSNDNFITIS